MFRAIMMPINLKDVDRICVFAGQILGYSFVDSVAKFCIKS